MSEFGEQSGKHVLGLSSSQFDPKATSGLVASASRMGINSPSPPVAKCYAYTTAKSCLGTCSDASSSRSSAARWHGRLQRVRNRQRCLSLVRYPSVGSSRILRQRSREVSRREVTWSEKTSG